MIIYDITNDIFTIAGTDYPLATTETNQAEGILRIGVFLSEDHEAIARKVSAEEGEIIIRRQEDNLNGLITRVDVEQQPAGALIEMRIKINKPVKLTSIPQH